MKTVSDRIFELLKEKKMTQKEFAQRTGIAESSISDWKRKRTNPVSDKILIICEVLEVTPYELLSGAEHSEDFLGCGMEEVTDIRIEDIMTLCSERVGNVIGVEMIL